LEHYRLYLLSLQNKSGPAIYLDAHNDADALTRAPAASSYPMSFRPLGFGKASAKWPGSTRSVPGAMDRHSLRFESTWWSATSTQVDTIAVCHWRIERPWAAADRLDAGTLAAQQQVSKSQPETAHCPVPIVSNTPPNALLGAVFNCLQHHGLAHRLCEACAVKGWSWKGLM